MESCTTTAPPVLAVWNCVRPRLSTRGETRIVLSIEPIPDGSTAAGHRQGPDRLAVTGIEVHVFGPAPGFENETPRPALLQRRHGCVEFEVQFFAGTDDRKCIIMGRDQLIDSAKRSVGAGLYSRVP